MLHITILTVGRLKEAYLLQAMAEYQKRLSAFCKLSVVEVEEYRLPHNPSDAQIQKGIEQEGRNLLDKLPPRGVAIPLCIEGKQITSEELAQTIGEFSISHSQITFVIGGSHGLCNEIKRAGALRLSLSKMTFPHQLARVLVAEQVYRAFSILGGGKYHK